MESRPASSRSTAVNAALYLFVGVGCVVVGLTEIRGFLWMAPVWLFGASLLAIRAWRRRDRGSQP